MIKAGRTALIAFGAALMLAGGAHAATYVFLTPDEVDAAIHALPAPPAAGAARNPA